MYELQISLEEIRNGSALKQCKEIAAEIVKGNCDILKVVISLKECLTHPEPLYRGGGISFLTNVMRELPKSLLNSKELTQLSEYICDRLKDHNSMASANLTAVLVLLSMENLDADCVKKILDVLFDNVPCQQQDKKDRLVYMTILRLSFAKYPKAIQEMGDDILKSFIESVDGERDPQVLVLNFKSFVELSKLLPNAEISEDIFEVFGVYFPIDFSAPVEPDRPYTRDNLAKLLKKSLLAYKAFAKYAIPLALEKLDSDFEVAKIDSLEFLIESCDIYGDSDYKPHLHEMTKLLRLEILRGCEAKTCSLSLILLCRLSETLQESLHEFVDTVLNFCLIFLLDDSMTQQHLIATYVLYATALGSKSACEKILNRVIPIIITKNVTINTVSQLYMLLHSYQSTKADLESKIFTDFVNWFTNQKTNDIKILVMMSSCIVKDKSLIPFNLTMLQQMSEKDEQFTEIFMPLLLANEITETKIEILIRLMFKSKVSKTCCQCFIEHLKNPALFQKILLKFLDVYEAVNDSNDKFNIVKTLIEEYDFIDSIENTLQSSDVVMDENLLYGVRNIFVIISQQSSAEQLNNVLGRNRCSIWNCKTLALYNGIIYGINKSELQINYITDLISCLVKSALSDSPIERFFANMTMYYLINKIVSEELSSLLLSKLNYESNEGLLLRKVESSSWLAKGLLLRSDKKYEDLLRKCADLDDSHIPTIYRILCYECPIPNGNISILHKQRLFVTTEKLFNSKMMKPDIRLFTYNLMITCIPKTILHMYKDILTTILVDSIRSEDKDLQWISLYNTKNILELSPDENGLCSSLYENVDKMLPRVLHLLETSDHQENQKITLYIVSHYGTSKKYLIKLLQYKQQVLACLKRCLNNQSRIVRFIVQKSIENWKNIDS
ncbi:MMS19 nucleotide excision repair protein homolog [Ctenocephalides felis]|uniref:MMS19 nucleotide excision repair protein homolog n=1 Tax=Ctenocephalides felis TaxID=7515 RepID=UPI000E6E3D1B|nr:MMS19 nucleotide excision repair protein homolog [Ctenocephalides felis]